MNELHCDGAVVIADESALTELCGISLLERLLRNLQRLGVKKAQVVCANDTVARQACAPTWARSDISVRTNQFDPAKEAFLFLHAGVYHDVRLLRALCEQTRTTLLIDSAPSADLLPLVRDAACAAAQVEPQWLQSRAVDFSLFAALRFAAAACEIAVIDVEKQPRYIADLRRAIRPLWFPAPRAENAPKAEHLLLDGAQNGTLDLPAKAHAPIETWLVGRLCRTAITPNQITLFTAIVSAVTAVLFATGRLTSGTILALIVGVLDGLDGKLARVKVETTPLGKREHVIDYMLELSWWTALAWHFSAYGPLVLLVASDLVDRLAKRAVKKKTGRNLDDVAPLDRFVRLIGGRRNIYVWMFATRPGARHARPGFCRALLVGRRHRCRSRAPLALDPPKRACRR